MYLLLFLVSVFAYFLLHEPLKHLLEVYADYSIPKFFSKNKMYLSYIKEINDQTIRNGYSKKKIPTDIDVIVIGSGISALTNAALLSLCGKRVLVLEQHYIAGGSTHSFEDKGYEFDTGIHYIGNIEKRKEILDLITMNKIEWEKMGTKENGYVYDQVVIGDKTYYLRAGEDGFLQEIEKYFPEEIENVKLYLKDVKETSKKDLFFMSKIIQNKYVAKFVNKFLCNKFYQSVKDTAQERVEKYTSNKDLQSLLLAQFADYGQSPKEESFFLHASVVNHYLNGGWYPKGGSSEIAKNIVPIIEKTGGKVLVRKAVKSILIENYNGKPKAIGVEMSNGDKIYADEIVSSVGAYNTWNKLVPEEYVPHYIKERIDQIGFSCSFTYVFIGMKGTPEELGLINHNIWHFPDKDFDKVSKNFLENHEYAPIPMFIGFPCAKDSTWNKRYPGRSNAVILSMARYKDFEEWENQRQGHRSDDYNSLKNIYANRILEEGLYKYFPKTDGKVDYVSVGSPLTFNHYIGTNKGEVYGLKATPDRYQEDDILRPKTHIDGLYQTGQDITTLGVTGAMMSGVLTAHVQLGYGTILDLWSERNLIKDLKNIY